MSFSDLHQRLLNDFQREFPLTPEPYAELAEALGVDETTVLHLLEEMQSRGIISRVGPVFAPNRVGVSTLAAMAVPPDRLDRIAGFINAYPEVNHNYEREHRFNLWFVITAASAERLAEMLAQIEDVTGLSVLSLPLLEEFHIDLGFPLQWGTT
jgi:DNA-binding Lrp family transcriptional regulator